MRTLLIITGVVVVLAVAVFGFSGLMSHFGAVRQGVKEAVESVSSADHVYRRLQAAVKDDYERLEDYWVKVAEAKSRLRGLKESNIELRNRLKKNRDVILPRAVEILEQHEGQPDDTEVKISGKSYTLAQVQDELDFRLKASKKFEEEIAENEQHIAGFRETTQRGAQKVEEVQQHIKDLQREAKSAMDKIRYEQFEAERIALEEAIRSDFPAIDSEASESAKLVSQLKKRGAEAEQRNIFRRKKLSSLPASEEGVIDWEGRATLLEDAKSYLSGDEGRQKPAEKPDVGQAPREITPESEPESEAAVPDAG